MKYGRVLHKLNQAFGIWTFEGCQEHDRGKKAGSEILVEQKTGEAGRSYAMKRSLMHGTI